MSARVATTANITLDNTTTTVDGVTLANGDLVLVKNQTTGTQNGLYVASTTTTWTRSSLLPVAANAYGIVYYVTSGTVNKLQNFKCVITPAVVGTDSLVFMAFNNALLNNLSASTNPTVTDDNTKGYSVGSIWINTTGNTVYTCTNSGTGAAVWTQGGTGDVVGPASATDKALTRFNGTTGKLVQNSGVTLSDTQGLAGVKTLGLAGATSGTLTVQPAGTVTSYTITMPAAQGAANSFLQNDGAGAISWGTTAPSATNLTGATANTVPYQSSSGTTSYYTYSQLNGALSNAGATQTIYVSNLNGSDTNNGLSPQTSVATLTKALTLVASGGIIMVNRSGTIYSDSPTITVQNITIMSDAYNGSVAFSGTITVANTASNVSMKGLSIATLVHNNAGALYMFNCTVTTAFSSTSSGYFLAYDSDFQGSGSTTVSITGTGTKIFGTNCFLGATTINNASVLVGLNNINNSLAITVTAGILSITNSVVYASSAPSNALSVASGAIVYLQYMSFIVSGTTNPALINIASGAFYSELGVTRSASSTISGTLLSRSPYFDALNSFNLGLRGSTSGTLTLQTAATTTSYTITMPSAQGAASTFLQNNGSGTLSWASISGGGNVSGPGSSTNTALARWNGTTGTALLDSGVTLSNTQDLVGIKTLGLAGATSGTLTVQPAATVTSYTIVWPAAQGSASTYLQNDGSGTLSWSSAGNVTGPGSSTTNAIARYSDTTGKVLLDSSVTLSSTQDLVGVKTLGLAGATSGTLTVQPAATTTSYTVTMPAAQGGASTFLQNNGSGTLSWVAASGSGTVTGPVSSTNTALVRWNGTGGTVIQDSGVTLSNTQDLAGVKTLSYSGSTSGTLTVKPAATVTSYTVTWPSAQGDASTFLQNDGSGTLSWTAAVTGPGSSTNTALARWNGTGGTVIQDSGVTLSNTQDLAGVKTMSYSGSTSGTMTFKPAATVTSYTATWPSAQGGASTYLQNDGTGALSWQTITISTEFLIGNLSATVTTNITDGNHPPFNQAFQSSNGTANTGNISLDTTSAYSSGTNTASIGRITLKAGLTYALMGIIKSLGDVLYYGYSWYNSDTNTRIGTRGESFSATNQMANAASNPSYSTFTPSVDTRVELRLTESATGTIVNWYNGSGGFGETMFQISVVRVANGQTAFGGATSSVAGSQGLVPAPTAGQQNRFLKGDGTWGQAVFNQTTAQRTTSTTDVVFNTDTDQLEFYNGSNYITNNIVAIATTGQTGALTDRLVLFTPPSSTTITYTLPDPSVTYGTTIQYRISRSVTALNATVTLNAPASRTVNGAASFTLSCIGDYVVLFSNGTDWVVISKPTGMLLITDATLSASANQNFDNVFSSKYSGYVVELYLLNAAGSGGFNNTWRLRSGGANISAANYYIAGRYQGPFTGDINANNQAAWVDPNFFNWNGAGDYLSQTFEIVNPQSTTQIKRFSGTGNYSLGLTATYSTTWNGTYKVLATTADGWGFSTGSGTVTGTVKIYARCAGI